MTTTVRPSVVITLEADGRMMAETWRNGGRIKFHLYDSIALQQLRSELEAQQRELDHRAAEARERQERAAEARHQRVFADMAARHGLGFAKSKLRVPDSLKSAVSKADKAQQSPISLDEALSL